MSRLTKIMLELLIINTVLAALFLTGIVNVSDFPALYLTFPAAAIFYGMFLICRFLEKEVAEFDAEQREHYDQAAQASHSESDDSLHRGHGHHAPMHA
jgi:amino acid permease